MPKQADPKITSQPPIDNAHVAPGCTPFDEATIKLNAWDRWYRDLPADLRQRLSIHDFKRLGDLFKAAFGL